MTNWWYLENTLNPKSYQLHYWGCVSKDEEEAKKYYRLSTISMQKKIISISI